MRFRNSLRLLMENFKHTYKLLWAKLIITLIASALCCAFLLPELNEFWNSAQVQNLVKIVKDFLSTVLSEGFSGIGNLKKEVTQAGKEVVDLLSSSTLEIVLCLIGCVVVYFLKRFVETICHFTTGSMLNDKMATYAETGYSTALVSNLGKASAYSAVYASLILLYDVAIIAVVCVILAFVPFIAALFCSVTAVAFLQAFKLTITYHWMPAMTVDGKKLSAAMRCDSKTEKKQRSKLFSTYLVGVYLVIIVNVAAAICTFGSALLISIPASYFFFICMQYVNYYTVKGKRYFLTYEQIASNPDHGDSEHFFDYLGESETGEADVSNENKK